jgi:hypothetical protein
MLALIQYKKKWKKNQSLENLFRKICFWLMNNLIRLLMIKVHLIEFYPIV